MNTLLLHPAVVHVPLGLAVVMPLLLAAMLWAVATGRLPGKAWLLPLLLQGVLLGAAALALRTGERDEDRVEGRVSEAAVEVHAHSARVFTVAAGATFVAAALAMGLRNRRGPFLATAGASVVLAVAMLVLGIEAGGRGGTLVHGAVESAGRAPGPGHGATVGEGEEAEDDDD